jgi:hypothetical protein
MNKQIIVFLCFNNVNHIKQSFDSMYCDDIDYFVVENISNYSEEIKNYFLDKKKTCNSIVGYIQFQKNIVGNAINIFIRKYGDLLRKYEYITFTDGDYYVYDMKSTVQEILMAFNYPDCAVSSVDLYPYSNWRHPNRIIGTNYYIEYMKKRENIQLNNVIGIGIPSLMTLQKKDLFILESIYYYDGNIRNKLHEIHKSWYITTKNLLYHLTDECCYDEFTGDEYMTWKRSIGHKIWQVTEEANYIELIK